MEDILIFLLCNFVMFVIVALSICIRSGFIYLTDKFVDWVYKRIKEKEMEDYIEHQFDNSRRKHTP